MTNPSVLSINIAQKPEGIGLSSAGMNESDSENEQFSQLMNSELNKEVQANSQSKAANKGESGKDLPSDANATPNTDSKAGEFSGEQPVEVESSDTQSNASKEHSTDETDELGLSSTTSTEVIVSDDKPETEFEDVNPDESVLQILDLLPKTQQPVVVHQISEQDANIVDQKSASSPLRSDAEVAIKTTDHSVNSMQQQIETAENVTNGFSHPKTGDDALLQGANANSMSKEQTFKAELTRTTTQTTTTNLTGSVAILDGKSDAAERATTLSQQTPPLMQVKSNEQVATAASGNANSIIIEPEITIDADMVTTDVLKTDPTTVATTVNAQLNLLLTESERQLKQQLHHSQLTSNVDENVNAGAADKVIIDAQARATTNPNAIANDVAGNKSNSVQSTVAASPSIAPVIHSTTSSLPSSSTPVDVSMEQLAEAKLSQSPAEELILEESQKKPNVDAEIKSAVAKTLAQQLANQQAFSTVQDGSAPVHKEASSALGQSIDIQSVQTKAQSSVLQNEVIAIHRRDFVSAVQEKVMFVINQRLQRFEIQLDPPELGSMQIKVSMQNEQAVVNFVVQNQQAKDALEQNIVKLKEMMAEQGLDVADANVKHNQQGQSETHSESEQRGQTADSDWQEEQDSAVIHANLVESSATGVDYYV